jgi:peptidoglycan/xylan/chitin deacetylase (PgdA/CDA1 family)
LCLDKPIYVLLYHPWLSGFEEYFTRHLAWLREKGFETIPLEDLLYHVKGEEIFIPDRPIVMTFDDGSVENYTVVYPLLKQYGFSGTVFAPTADKYIQKSGIDWWKEVEKERFLRIEGHSHTHALIFINDHVENFYVRGKNRPEPIIKGLDERSGAPIFELGYELVSHRFIPDREFVEWCVNYVEQNGGESLFESENWKDELLRVVSRYPGNRGRYETEEENGKRLKDEIELSKSIIEKVIGNGKKVQFFAYPFGAYDVHVLNLLKSIGYRGAFTTLAGGNLQGDDPFLIKRMTILEEDSFGGLASILKEY